MRRAVFKGARGQAPQAAVQGTWGLAGGPAAADPATASHLRGPPGQSPGAVSAGTVHRPSGADLRHKSAR